MGKLYVEVRREDRPLLDKHAWLNHRSPSEHAAYLLSRAIRAEEAEQPATPSEDELDSAANQAA